MDQSISKVIRPILIIWYRELLRYWRNRLRSISGLAMPFIWLVMFGSGISGSLRFGGPVSSFNYVQFLFAGVLGINILFTSMFSAMTLVRDREFGFLKEIFVAPISRASIALGKILGGATVATIQGSLMLILLPLVGLPLSFGVLALFPFIFLFSLMINSLAVAISAKISSIEAFQMVMQFLTFPMFMLSGALFPLRNIPAWLSILSKVNPATYGVDLLRQVSFKIFEVPKEISLGFGISLFGRSVPIILDVFIIFILSILMIGVSALLFARQDT